MAKGKGHKKQHFVPVCYLKPWCDPATPTGHTPYVWLFDCDGQNPRAKSPTKILHETDMYTIEVPGGGRNLRLEKGLSALEDKFARIRNCKIKYGRPLDKEEHMLLCFFIAAARARTPANREHQRRQWAGPLRIMEEMIAWSKTATVEEKKRAASLWPRSAEDSKGSLTYAQVKALHEKRQCILLNRRGVTGYITARPFIVDELNRRTRFTADEHFVVRVNKTKPVWFDAGVEPDDSWDKLHAKGLEGQEEEEEDEEEEDEEEQDEEEEDDEEQDEEEQRKDEV
jgi:hypothetical protein